MTAAAWAVTEAAGAQLGDRRRNAAWACILTALLAGAGRSFSAALGQALRQAASSLCGRPGLSVAELLAGHYQATAGRCAAQPLVLVSQDSTCFNYTRRRTSGLGRLAVLAVRRVPLMVRSPKSWPAAEQDELAVAVVVVDWYRRRWTVELAHRALKLDGYRVERLQLRTAAALQLALASYWVVAWRAMNLALEARENPDLPAAERFGADELEVLSRLSGKPVTRLVEAVHEVAKLGGWAGYRWSPPPGTQVVQQGLLLLEPIVRYHRALREPPTGDEM